MSYTGGLASAQALAHRQPAAYDAAPNNVHSTGGRFDAGHSGSFQTPLLDKIETRPVRHGKVATFPGPIGSMQKVTKDEEMSRLELNVPILHDKTPFDARYRSFFIFSPGMIVWNAIEFNRASHKGPAPRGPAITMINTQGVNMLLREAFHWGEQAVSNKLHAPGKNNSFVPADRGESTARPGYYDVYDPEPVKFDAAMEELQCDIPGYAVTHQEVSEKFRILGLWLSEGQPQANEYYATGVKFRGDPHSEHYINSPGVDAVSTVTMAGRYMAGVPNLIGPSARDIMWFGLMSKRATAPRMWDSLEGYSNSAIQIVPYASNRIARPLMHTSSRHHIKWTARHDEQQYHPSAMLMWRYGGVKRGVGEGVTVDFLRAPGERNVADVCSADRSFFEPYQDRTSYGVRTILDVRGGGNVCQYVTIDYENAWSIGNIYDLSGVKDPAESDIAAALQDPTLSAFHGLKSMSKFQVNVTSRPGR